MQPLRLAADSKSGLIHVLHQCAGDEIAHRFSKIPQSVGVSAAYSRDRRSGHFNAEEIGHQYDHAVLGAKASALPIKNSAQPGFGLRGCARSLRTNPCQRTVTL